MSTAHVVGTWFPTGYYGHYRSKTRNDILQEYRHVATPSPPNKFIHRVRKCPDVHSFSKHDNRHSFPTDASYFDTGLGRRKADSSITAFKKEFMYWMPHKQEIERAGSLVSLYKVDFRKGGERSTEPIPQVLSPRIRKRAIEMEATDARLKWLSDYKRQFSHGQPNRRIDTDLNTGHVYDGPGQNARTHQYINTTGRLKKVVPSYLEHVRRRTKSAPPIRYSVGDCLVWYPNPATQAPSTCISPRAETGNRLYQSLPHPPVAEPHQASRAYAHLSKTVPGSMTPAATSVSTFSPEADVTSGTTVTVTGPGLKVPAVVVD